MIAASYHKTGTILLKNIFMDIYKNSQSKYTFSYWFWKIKNEQIKKNKCVVIIRHPYEIICSGMRYHQVAKEPWLDVPNIKYDNMSYKDKLKSMDNVDDKILFEMNHTAYDTINYMYNDIKNRNFNNNIYLLKLEDLYDINNLPKICSDICRIINDKTITYDIIYKAFVKNLKRNFHRTNQENSHTFPQLFKDIHYDEFNKLFPKDTMEVIGY
tara:strand:+ start:38 stop:676 length:639 start_codon:yes stop_codon:yes gene_type:complete